MRLIVKKVFFMILILPLLMSAQQVNVWGPLQFLEGTWEGQEEIIAVFRQTD